MIQPNHSQHQRISPALIVLALLSLLSVSGCNIQPTPASFPKSPDRPRALRQRSAATQPFDFYLLNLSWSPEYCQTHPSARECAQHLRFILHGLWPQNDSGPFPENCSHAPGPPNPAAYSDIYPDPGLLRHEWQTHGTCSGLSPDDFFTLARTALHAVAVPATLTQIDREISVAPPQLLKQFQEANPTFPPGSIALSCGNNRLTAVEVCLNASAKPIPCGPIRSCRANSIRITPP